MWGGFILSPARFSHYQDNTHQQQETGLQTKERYIMANYDIEIYPKSKMKTDSGVFYVCDKNRIKQVDKNVMWESTKEPIPKKRHNRNAVEPYIIINNKAYDFDCSFYMSLKSIQGDNVGIWNAYEKFIGQYGRRPRHLLLMRYFSNRNDYDNVMRLIKLMIEEGISDYNVLGIDGISSALELAKTSITDEELKKSNYPFIKKNAEQALEYRRMWREQ